MRLLSCPRIKYGAGFEDEQKSCAILVGYLLRVTFDAEDGSSKDTDCC